MHDNVSLITFTYQSYYGQQQLNKEGITLSI